GSAASGEVMTQPNVDFRSELTEHAGGLRSLALRLVSPGDAEDLTHDAMVTALSQATKPRRVRPWLRQVLRNEARAQRRSSNRRQAREQRAAPCEEPPSLEALAAHGQVASAVRAALVELDPSYRRVLEARFLGERTAAEIARSEGCPAGTVRWRVQEGLRRMRSSLDARFEDREAWRGRMAAFAVAPLSWAVTTPAETTMISSSLFTKLALGTLTTAAAGVAIVATVGGTEVTPQEPSSRPQISVSTTTPTAEKTAPRRFSTGLAARASSDGRLPDREPTDSRCETCSDSGMPSFGPISECQARFSVSEYGRVNINVTLDGTVVDTVTVRSQSELDGELVTCLEETLPGAEAMLSEDRIPSQEMNLVLVADVKTVPQDIDAPTPVEMAAGGLLPVRSEGEAPTRTVVACADYGCAFCDKARVTLDQVLDEYPDLQLAWMQFPLESGSSGSVGARAAVAAHAQGKFWEMHALLFDRPGPLGDDDVRAIAKAVDLDLARFERDFTADSTVETVEAQRASCVAAGATGTPSFFVGDTVMVGAQPIEAFRALLD
ncbi:MAG: sigma-70 family RNA polymerase sigma factor, partial [Nannocystaceae bacterium]|nr:sigma-70 family RNA polymerase sigma factor [Nannocystaceae bacterium]